MRTRGKNAPSKRTASRSITRITIAAVLAVLVTVSDTTAQKATEQYIPIGASPGVSGEQSHIGRIVSSDDASNTLAIETDTGLGYSVRVTETTRIWVDRSASALPNIEGSFADCRVGRLIEAMYASDDPEAAVWIKVRIP
jgi:hypothetical protein